MNRYWDLSPQQRAALTSEQVEALLDVELMEKGVAKVDPPLLVEEPEVTLTTSEYFEVQFEGEYARNYSTNFVFATAEQANQFIDAGPIERKTDYDTNRQVYAKPCRGLVIAPVHLPSEQEVLSMAAKFLKLTEAKEANKKARDAYAEVGKAVTQAVSSVWEDWYAQCSEARAAHEVQKTREEYCKLCEGKSELAETFLVKAYDQVRVDEANEWLEQETAEVAVTEG